MNRSKIPMLLGLALLVTFNNAQADLFGSLKSKLTSETKQKVIKKGKETSNSAQSSSNVSLEGGPSESLISMTTCAKLKPENITVGYMGNYTFQNGFKKEKRSGLIKRQSGELTHGCILPSLQSRQIAYMEVDTKAYEALGSSNDWTMQCIDSDNPGAGALSEKESRTESIYSVDAISGKDMMLYCGNSENVTECSEGSNSQRSGAWSKKLKANGKTMLSILAFTSPLAPNGGQKLFCQYYNKKSRVSLFAVEYLRLKK
ncbi:hypothetical protein ACOYR1_15410 [Thalassotalea piscium]